MAKKKVNSNEWLDNPKRILVGGVVVGVGGFLLYKFGSSIFQTINHRNTEGQADSNPDVQQALALRSAINPSGISWMKSFDGTNTAALLDTAKQIKNLDAVSSAYRQLYNDDLLMDVQSELSSDDYQKFLTLVSSNPVKSGGKPQTFAKKNQLIVAKADLYLRTSPDASYHGAIYEIADNHNIIRLAKAGEFLGYATGKQSFDVKNNVKFIEVAYLIKKENLPANLKSFAGKKYSYWISSSANYVDQFAYYNDMLKQYPATQNEVAYKKPLDFYSGVKGISGFGAIPIITKHKTAVLDDKLQPIMQVQSGTLLGEYIMSLNTGAANYIQFRTIDNTKRWVNAEFILTKN
jgi:hypothetical protein